MEIVVLVFRRHVAICDALPIDTLFIENSLRYECLRYELWGQVTEVQAGVAGIACWDASTTRAGIRVLNAKNLPLEVDELAAAMLAKPLHSQ